MTTNLKVAFWNVQNLFEPGIVSRGPQSRAELDAKLDVLADEIDSFFGGDGPDVLGLAEVHTETVLLDLLGRLRHLDHYVWEDGTHDQTGLALLVRSDRFANLRIAEVYRKTFASRPRYIVVRCELQGVQEAFSIVVNHWKSRMPASTSHELDRQETADELGDYLANRSPETCIVVLGDFNAEPFESPFGELRLRAKRTFSNALWTGGTPAYLYNNAWRLLREPDFWEDASAAGYQEPSPKTTHSDSGVYVFDHLLVSGRALRNGPLTLLEKTVLLHLSARTSRRNRNGVIRPRPWKYSSPSNHEGSSDHLPLLATFAVK
jgi:endonuclease/exonuclease/phosphatase family metal-dependent hydrolase